MVEVTASGRRSAATQMATVVAVAGVVAALTLLAVIITSPPADAQSTSGQQIRPTHSGLCLGVEGGSTAATAAVVQQQCNGADYQSWTTTDVGGGYIRLAVAHTGMCLNVEASSTADLARLIQYPCSDTANEQFELRPVTTDTVHLVARHSDKCVDIEAASTAAGARAIQYGCHFGANQTFALTSTQVDASQGIWGPVETLPLVPVAASALPDGRILMWSSSRKFGIGPAREGYTESVIFNPANGSLTEQRVTATEHNMFCPGIAHLADGRILINGGSSAAETSIYDPATGQWQDAEDMNITRGYNGSTLLGDGSAFTVGGSWSGGQGGKSAEVWTDGQGWRRLDGIPADPLIDPDPRGIYRADNHMWLFAWTDDRVFHAGPSEDMHWLGTTGNGSITNVGRRGNDTYAMNGNAVMYDVGKILTVGGAPAYDSGDATSRATVIDINGQTVTSRNVAPMANRRSLHSSVVLPNGEVVVTGGQEVPRLFTDERAIMTTEIWNPDSETFRTAAPMSVPRTYHSFSLLLPDGRVVVGGGGLCGTCSTNHPDIQIFTPPYLLDRDGSAATRPQVVSAPDEVDLNERFAVSTSGAVSEFALVRMSSATHSVNNDQRRIPLSHSGSGGSFQLQMPAEPGVAIPGLYMLFALDGDGTPSVAEVIRVTAEVAQNQPAQVGGTVTEGGGSAVGGVAVDLFTEGRAGYLDSTVTDGSGTYAFDVEPGCYVVTMVAPDGRSFPGGQYQNVEGCVTAGQQNLSFDATLVGGGGGGGAAVTGQVVEGGGSPVGGVAVDLFSSDSSGRRISYLRSTSSDGGGNYRFDLDAGCYALTFVAPSGRTFSNGSPWFNTDLCLAAGETASGVDAVLIGGGGGSEGAISGAVSDGPGGSGVAGIDIDLFAALADGSRGSYLRSAVTDGDGDYTFATDSGCYVVTFVAPSGRTWVESGSQWWNASACTDGGETSVVDATLAP